MASGGFSITVNKQSHLSPKYILGLLNSRLLFWRLKTISNVFRGGWVTCTKQYVNTLPIRTIDFSVKHDRNSHDYVVGLVDRMLDLHNRLQSTTTDHERTIIQRQIAATDQQIDHLVYELYGLSKEEIAIVEDNAQ